jgi:hypothetical protein
MKWICRNDHMWSTWVTRINIHEYVELYYKQHEIIFLDFKFLPCFECCIPSFEWIPGVGILCACLHRLRRWNRQSVPKGRHIKSDIGDSPKRKNTTWNDLSYLYVNIWIDFLVLPHPTCMDTENLDSSLFIW